MFWACRAVTEPQVQKRTHVAQLYLAMSDQEHLVQIKNCSFSPDLAGIAAGNAAASLRELPRNAKEI
jgi:hypothetical protein